MKNTNRTAARQTNKDNITIAAMKKLSCLFWMMFGAAASTIRAMINVKVALDD